MTPSPAAIVVPEKLDIALSGRFEAIALKSKPPPMLEQVGEHLCSLCNPTMEEMILRVTAVADELASAEPSVRLDLIQTLCEPFIAHIVETLCEQVPNVDCFTEDVGLQKMIWEESCIDTKDDADLSDLYSYDEVRVDREWASHCSSSYEGDAESSEEDSTVERDFTFSMARDSWCHELQQELSSAMGAQEKRTEEHAKIGDPKALTKCFMSKRTRTNKIGYAAKAVFQ